MRFATGMELLCAKARLHGTESGYESANPIEEGTQMVNDTLAEGARAAHDWGLASWLGGSMYGKFALNPAVRQIDDKTERGKVVNAAWNGYNVINAVSLGSVAVGWFASRLTETRPDRLTERERKLALAKDGLTLAALGTGIASAIQGAKLARQAPEGAVPIEGGTKPASETPPEAAKAQRSLNGLGLANIGAGVGLVIVNALMSQAGHSRPPLRRSLLRRSS
jgi:hypothetical protein